ncbi:MAG: hypothetical protein WDZ93_01605 [Candidatus Paceibacterota bacterium]
MSNLVWQAVTVACLTAGIIGMLWGTKQPTHETQQTDMISMLIEEHGDVVAQPIVPVRVPEDADVSLIKEIIANEMLRLEVIEQGFKSTEEVIKRFLEFVKLIESNGDQYARASTSSAMSLFQFTKGSVPTAVNRLGNYMARHHLGPVPEWAVELKESPMQLFEVPEKRQAILTLVNIIEQRGSDTLLRTFLQGEYETAKAIYYAHHHTAPDEATLRRTERIFAQIFN